MQTIEIQLSALQAHPLNSNVMSQEMVTKLAEHLRRTGRYPPVIIRPVTHSEDTTAQQYQILDGHHRVAALRSIGATTARCVVWEVDDDEALLLLATLNRLQGQDDPRKRAALILELRTKRGSELRELSALLPERTEQLTALTNLADRPRVVPARQVDDLPVSVHFFLPRDQRDRLETKLRAIGPSREAGLMKLVDSSAENID